VLVIRVLIDSFIPIDLASAPVLGRHAASDSHAASDAAADEHANACSDSATSTGICTCNTGSHTNIQYATSTTAAATTINLCTESILHADASSCHCRPILCFTCPLCLILPLCLSIPLICFVDWQHLTRRGSVFVLHSIEASSSCPIHELLPVDGSHSPIIPTHC